MYCGHCGSVLKDKAKFCGHCGSVVSSRRVEEVVYVEEKPLTPILEDKAVLALTFCVLVLSILTIVVSSIIVRDVPSSNRLQGGYEFFHSLKM